METSGFEEIVKWGGLQGSSHRDGVAFSVLELSPSPWAALP
ncbi:hypothetical protein [Baaleninema sp.]